MIDREEIAKTIYWAAWEMYPPNGDPSRGPVNPIAKMTRDESWHKTSQEHHALCRFQAEKVLELLGES